MKIGMTEILLILIIALFVIGPDKLPEFTQKLGQGLKQFRKFSSEATKEIRENVVEPLEEAQKPLREAMEPVAELTKEVSDDVNGIKKSFTDLTKPMKITPSKNAAEKTEKAADDNSEPASADDVAATEESGQETPTNIPEESDKEPAQASAEKIGKDEPDKTQAPAETAADESEKEPNDNDVQIQAEI